MLSETTEVDLRLLCIAAALALASFAHAQSDDMVPAIVIDLKFTKDAVEIAGKHETDEHVYRQLGVPQRSAMFFETTGEKGEVLYAAEVGDPNSQRLEGEREADWKARVEHGTTITVTMPRQPPPRKFTLYRRTGGDKDTRAVVVEGSL